MIGMNEVKCPTGRLEEEGREVLLLHSVGRAVVGLYVTLAVLYSVNCKCKLQV